MRICKMFNPEQELDPTKFMNLAAKAYQLAVNALETSKELHRLDSVERVNTDSDTGTHTTVPPTAPPRRHPGAQRPPRPRAQRPSHPSDSSTSASVPPTQLGDATTLTKTTLMSTAHITTPISSAHTTFIFVPTPSLSTPHHKHTVNFLTQTFSPLSSFLGVTPSSDMDIGGPSLPT